MKQEISRVCVLSGGNFNLGKYHTYLRLIIYYISTRFTVVDPAGGHPIIFAKNCMKLRKITLGVHVLKPALDPSTTCVQSESG